MLIMGFGHRARQGKNTAALAVLESTPIGTDIGMYAFADALRKEVRSACATMGGQFELIQEWKAAGLMPEWVEFETPKPRSLLQWWGTEYRRKQDPDYWVKKLQKTLDNDGRDYVLITDVRFPNEVDAIHRWGGVYVEIVNTNAPDVDVREHVSEAALDGVKPDYLLTAGSADECKAGAVAIFNRIVRQRAQGSL